MSVVSADEDGATQFSVILSASVGAAWKNTTDELFTHIVVTQGSYTKADVPAALDAQDDGEGEVEEEKPV